MKIGRLAVSEDFNNKHCDNIILFIYILAIPLIGYFNLKNLSLQLSLNVVLKYLSNS
jgi:hypothetical protein